MVLDKASSVTHLETVDPAIASTLRFLVVRTRWNSDLVDALVDGVVLTLTAKFQVPAANIDVQTVAGSFELPRATKTLLRSARDHGKPYAAAIPIGVLIKGSTMHFEYIAESVTHAIMDVNLSQETPLIFGVLTCLTDDQAKLRAGIAVGDEHPHNHGIDWASAAVEMALLERAASSPSSSPSRRAATAAARHDGGERSKPKPKAKRVERHPDLELFGRLPTHPTPVHRQDIENALMTAGLSNVHIAKFHPKKYVIFSAESPEDAAALVGLELYLETMELTITLVKAVPSTDRVGSSHASTPLTTTTATAAAAVRATGAADYDEEEIDSEEGL
ncbi:6,7-dimethyl-8-ribityllumazine synthase [Blastocladiella britannica]|nr:6,7-dimethyl-8-ribityllumazine synthase [Blastocladiella britannica]